jgi:hypothetical protein
MVKFKGLHKNCYKVYANRFIDLEKFNVRIVLFHTRTIFYFEYNLYEFH